MRLHKMMCLLLILLAVAASITNAAVLRVVINQTNAVIDTNPIINFSEIQFFKSGVLVPVYDENVLFTQYSSGFPPVLCIDGVLATGPGPYNMCKSGNKLASGQALTIFLINQDVDQMKIYNAHGFNNPSGQDVGKGIEGAVLTITDFETETVLFTYSFGAPFQALYTLNIPTPAPTMQPVTAPFAPTVTAKPTFTPAPTTTTKPSTNKPSLKPLILLARNNPIPVSETSTSGAVDDMAH